MEQKTSYMDKPVIAICSCLQLTIPEHPALSENPLDAGWVLRHDYEETINLKHAGKTPLLSATWACGAKHHHGLGTLSARLAYFSMRPLNPYGAPATRMADLIYCALQGWNRFYREDFWFATPYNSFLVDQDGEPSGIMVPFLTSAHTDWFEKWKRNNSVSQIDKTSIDQAKILAVGLIRLETLLHDMFEKEESGHQFSSAHLAASLNELSLTATKAQGSSATASAAPSGASLSLAELAKTMDSFAQIKTPMSNLFSLALTPEALESCKEAAEQFCKPIFSVSTVPPITMSVPPIHPFSVPPVAGTMKGEAGDVVWIDETPGVTYKGEAPGEPLPEHVNTKCVIDLKNVEHWTFTTDAELKEPLSDGQQLLLDLMRKLELSPEEAQKILVAHHEETIGGGMGKDSKIGWTHHTFNPWWGCSKCATGCKNCYAESLANRWKYNVWGQFEGRRIMSETYWQKPLFWNAEAERLAIAGERDTTYVFAGSMCDIFEFHSEKEWNTELNIQRARLWQLIEDTPALTWLLLTKRANKILNMIPKRWKIPKMNPGNVWYGGSVAVQDEMAEICDPLEVVRANTGAPYFLSVEPMIGPVRLGIYNPDWVIIGGESGPKARPFAADWALSLMHQDCKARGIPVYMKQVGTKVSQSAHLSDYKGADPKEWRLDLRVQQFPGEPLVWPARMHEKDKAQAQAANEKFDEWDTLEI